MSITLTTLNSKYIHTNLAIRYLKANAPAFDIKLKEYTLKDTLENIANDLLATNPKIIGFSVYIWNVEKTLTLINMLKEKDPTLT
ncbi:MAG: cobalamin-dependent protein, partial [Turicibacter sanguinis]